jgi:hypothetical protein
MGEVRRRSFLNPLGREIGDLLDTPRKISPAALTKGGNTIYGQALISLRHSLSGRKDYFARSASDLFIHARAPLRPNLLDGRFRLAIKAFRST